MKPYGYPLYTDFQFAGDMPTFITQVAAQFGDATAVSYREKPSDPEAVKISYRRFGEDIAALSRVMEAHGMRGAHCAVIGVASYDWVCLFYALQSIGAVMVPLDREWGAEELCASLATAECTYAFVDADQAEKLAGLSLTVYRMRETGDGTVSSLRAEDAEGGMRFPLLPDPRAMSMIVFTSGTTGKGKGVMLTQGGMLAAALHGRRLICPKGTSIMTLPPHHTYGMTINFIATFASGMNVYMSSGLRYITREMQTEKPEVLVLVPLYVESFYSKINSAIDKQALRPTVVRALRLSAFLRKWHIDVRRILFGKILAALGGKLRLIVCGGAPLRSELVREFDGFGITIINGYGITECSPLVACNRNKATNAGTVGYPLTCLDLRIANPDDEGNGEVRVKGENVMLGYYKAPELTAEAFDEDGYFRTGDIGRMNENGCLVLSGRSKNLIILPNGKNVYPEELETAIGAYDGVGEVVVYEGTGRTDPTKHAIVAEIRPTDDLLAESDEALEARYRTVIDAYNRGAVSYRKIDLLRVRRDEFPKNTLRKIQRFRIDTTID